MKRRFYLIALILIGIAISGANAYALTAGQTYTIEVDAIGSNGAIVDLAGLSTTATADSNGKVSFTITGVPDRTSYNFLVMSIKDSTGATVRRSIVPTPTAGGTTNLGVSPVTEGQTEAILSALSSAGTDNPIAVAFLSVILRTASLNSTQLGYVATAGVSAVTGFQNELTTLGVTASQLATFKSGIVSRLGQFTSLFKDAVDAATAAASAQNRGKAAGLLMQIFAHSATDAGFPEDYVELALMAAGDAVDDNASWSILPNSFRNVVSAEMGSAMLKIRAEKALKKYTEALTTLSASTSQIGRYNTAANNLFTAMENAFKTFEELFSDETTAPSDAAITAAQTAINTAMQTAFSAFITDAASTDAEITDMATAMKSGFCGGDAGCIAAINNMRGTTANNSMFSFRTQGGTIVYWPIPMVVPTTWTSNIAAAGGSLTYTRDTLAVPTSILTWLDSDDTGAINNTRHDWGDFDVQGVVDDDADEGNGVANDEKMIPASLASLFGLREDTQIIEFSKFKAFQDIGGAPTMAEMKGIMNTVTTRLAGRESALGGTTNGATAISTAQKKALVTTSLSPDFD